MTTTEFISDMPSLSKLEQNEDREITSTFLDPTDDESLIVRHKPFVEPVSRNGNIVLGALTTAYARIALYHVLDKYSKQVVYFDTDSVILLYRPEKGDIPPPISSSALGRLKDELEPGELMTSFSSIGPKCYTYE